MPDRCANARGPFTNNFNLLHMPAVRDRSAPSSYGLVILAAGESSRMGTPKQLLPLHGTPLIVRAVESALASPVWPVVVVVGANAEKIRPLLARYPVLVADNPAWAEGMASSIRAGVGIVQQFSRNAAGVVIALCDQPAFSSASVAQLISGQSRSGCSIVAARYQGRNGAPALFLRQHFPALTALTGEAGARDLLNNDSGQVAHVEMPDLAVDLDTPQDYARENGSAAQPTPPQPA